MMRIVVARMARAARIMPTMAPEERGPELCEAGGGKTGDVCKGGVCGIGTG